MRAEDRLQASVAQYLDRVLPSASWWTATANGAFLGGRTKLDRIKQWKRMERTGIKQGTPDLIICHEGRFLSIELKQEGEFATDAQNQVEDRIAIAGGGYAVCRSIEDVEQTLIGWGVPIRGSLRSGNFRSFGEIASGVVDRLSAQFDQEEAA